jgi:hypothetical protein
MAWPTATTAEIELFREHALNAALMTEKPA